MSIKGRVAQALMSLMEKFGVTEQGILILNFHDKIGHRMLEPHMKRYSELLMIWFKDKLIKLSGKIIKIFDDVRLKALTQQVVIQPEVGI